MTFRKLLLLKAFAVVCFSACSAQGGFDPFAIYQGSPIPSFPRNPGVPQVPHFRQPQQLGDSFFKSGVQPYSSNFFVGDKKSNLPKDDGNDYREKFRFNDDIFGPHSQRPDYLDSRPNRHHFSRPKPGRPQEDREDSLSVNQASGDKPMIFSFKLNKKFWNEKLKQRVDSLRKMDFMDEMEGYAKPSMQIGSRLMEWFRGIRGGADAKEDPLLVTKTTAAATATKKSSTEKTETEIDPPIYYTHTKSSTEIIRAHPGKRGVPPVAFSSNPDYDHSIEHYQNNNQNQVSEIPLGHILKANAGKGKANFNPRCNKGGSMIFCNSDALMGLLDLLEEHMQKSGGHFPQVNTNNNNDQYRNNFKFPGGGTEEYRQPMRIEVIEMDNNKYPQNGERPKGSSDFNEVHDVNHLNKPNDFSSHGSSGFGYEDSNGEIEIVIVVHTKEGSYVRSTHDQYGNYGAGYNNVYDMYRKPYKHFDDDVEQNNYDKKFERLKKILDIVRHKNNKSGRGNNDGWETDNYFKGNQHRQGHGQGNRHKGDDYWNSLIDEYKFGNYIPLHNSKDGPRQLRPDIAEDPNSFDGGLYVDMKDNDRYNYGRQRNPDRRGMAGEQYFGLARAGKSKHATKRERDGAIRSKLEQVYYRH